ncbi:hypothetical protein HU200_058035 [Digitaria exilis]|uniref:non-specific serine/threonine protein kinase n=1 Tax=Digitaria exilis TaxID=1010633 RepID=A0A835ANI5_9POAL|nr:hypothetical protein HU200_058035 [Digitaria exilis]
MEGLKHLTLVTTPYLLLALETGVKRPRVVQLGDSGGSPAPPPNSTTPPLVTSAAAGAPRQKPGELRRGQRRSLLLCVSLVSRAPPPYFPLRALPSSCVLDMADDRFGQGFTGSARRGARSAHWRSGSILSGPFPTGSCGAGGLRPACLVLRAWLWLGAGAATGLQCRGRRRALLVVVLRPDSTAAAPSTTVVWPLAWLHGACFCLGLFEDVSATPWWRGRRRLSREHAGGAMVASVAMIVQRIPSNLLPLPFPSNLLLLLLLLVLAGGRNDLLAPSCFLLLRRQGETGRQFFLPGDCKVFGRSCDRIWTHPPCTSDGAFDLGKARWLLQCSGCIYSEKNIRLFSYAELRSATDNFNRTKKVGRGGFGTVYKGTIRNGREVAVKVLSAESRQGIREFLTEIDVISNVKHPNLVELVGCCVEANNRILVYEYLQNSSLDRALLGSNSEPADFTWSIRSAICIGVARGLAYLHEEIASPIVHRDIKASNILLDKNYIPKIGDFGLAKLFPDNVTHISTRVAGTTGYLAPEYAWHGQLTKKADIYSFGVLVLEIISGTSSSKSILADDKILLEKAAAARRPSMPQVVTMLSKPIRINESELTSPGYIHEYRSNVSKASTSSHSRSKNSPSLDSNMFSTVVPPTVTEMSPR